jgi:hypothetical protein
MCVCVFESIESKKKIENEKRSFLFFIHYIYLCNLYCTCAMSSIVKTAAKGGATKTKEQLPKKKKKVTVKQTTVSKSKVPTSSLVNSSTSHQQHHSAPPQSQQSKAGLQSINENVEYLPTNGTNEQQQQQQHSTINPRFPRSSTVPYPAYATLRQGGGNRSQHYYYTDYPTFIHGTVSPAQANIYYNTRQPLSSINTNFQPISPHHQQYSNRPVDVLRPTFLIVPKEAEQQLSSQLSTSNSPVPPATTTTTKSSSKTMSKKIDTKAQEKSTAIIEQSSPTVRSVEVQTNDNSPTRTTTAAAGVTSVDNTYQHVGLMGTPNPSPYVHFVNVSYSAQSPQFLQDGPPETSIMQDEFININDYHQPSASIRSMPNIALAQGKNKKNSVFYILIFDRNTFIASNNMHIKTPPIDFLLSCIRLSSFDIASLTRFFVRQSLALWLYIYVMGSVLLLTDAA